MSLSISIPDELLAEARELGAGDMSSFALEAIGERLAALRSAQLRSEMALGYRSEAEASSLDPAWAEIEVDGLG